MCLHSGARGDFLFKLCAGSLVLQIGALHPWLPEHAEFSQTPDPTQF